MELESKIRSKTTQFKRSAPSSWKALIMVCACNNHPKRYTKRRFTLQVSWKLLISFIFNLCAEGLVVRPRGSKHNMGFEPRKQRVKGGFGWIYKGL